MFTFMMTCKLKMPALARNPLDKLTPKKISNIFGKIKN